MKNLYLGLAATALIATAATAQMVTPAKFVAEAGASDKFEIDSAKLMTGSKNAKVAGFARQMTTAHMKSTAMVAAAAKADGVAVKAPDLSIKQRADLTALKAVPAGKTKDELYVKQQKAAHAEALGLMQGYAASGTATHLKAAAGKIEPVVASHNTMLATM